jgi:hypothetical protein
MDARLASPRMTAFFCRSRQQFFVTAGLDPAVHAEAPRMPSRCMDARVKPAHDG